MPQLDRQDKLVTATAMAIILLAGILLYRDLQPSIDQSGTGVGKLVRQSGRVQRRGSGSSFWQNTRTKATVAQGEWLRTGDRARAEIQLENGASVELSPLSMIILYLRADEASLDLFEGSIRARPTSPIKIRSKIGKELSIGAGDFTANADNDALVIQAHSDSLAVSTPGGRTVLKRGDRLRADQHGSQLIVPVKLVFPANGATVDMTVRDSLAFRWEQQNQSALYRFELLRGNRLLINRVVRGYELTVRDLSLLDVGLFRWQITTLDSEQRDVAPAVSATFRIALEGGPGRPELHLPKRPSP